jgi:actinorhodin biosynthesis protein ActVIA
MAELSTEDRLEIEQLYATYNHSIDFGDSEAWANTFTADGSFDSGRGDPTVGMEALAGFAAGFAERVKGRHWTNNLLLASAT